MSRFRTMYPMCSIVAGAVLALAASWYYGRHLEAHPRHKRRKPQPRKA